MQNTCEWKPVSETPTICTLYIVWVENRNNGKSFQALGEWDGEWYLYDSCEGNVSISRYDAVVTHFAEIPQLPTPTQAK